MAFNQLTSLFNTSSFDYIFSNMQYAPTAPPTGPSLETLGYDLLTQICALADDESFIQVHGQEKTKQKPLAALAMTSRLMRELCAPALFREIVVRGNWKEGTSMLEGLSRCEEVMRCAKFVYVCITIGNVELM